MSKEPGAQSASQWEAELGGDLLKSVSRTFYLSLKLLPGGTRAPIALGYLLARASDTVADTLSGQRATKTEILTNFDLAIEGCAEARRISAEFAKEHAGGLSHPGEATLLARFDHCLSWLDTFDEPRQELVRSTLRTIIEGQRIDMKTFLSDTAVTAIATPGDLEHYTYCVAGSVGEFWTHVCSSELGLECFDDQPRKMLPAGIALGKGLQLINILRDFPVDWSRGRCYLPKNQIIHAGGSLEADPINCDSFKKVSRQWEGVCERYLDQGLTYVTRITSRRLRLATSLPLLFAIKTLRTLQSSSWEQRWSGVKISRSDTRRISARASVVSLSRVRLASFYKELGRNG